MKAVIYARYSSDSQREESIEGQLRECTAFAEKNGITVLRHYIDRAVSGKTDNRPEFQNMIKDSGKKLFDIIIVWKLDRFNIYQKTHLTVLFSKMGQYIEKIFITQVYAASDILIFSIYNLYFSLYGIISVLIFIAFVQFNYYAKEDYFLLLEIS